MIEPDLIDKATSKPIPVTASSRPLKPDGTEYTEAERQAEIDKALEEVLGENYF